MSARPLLASIGLLAALSLAACLSVPVPPPSLPPPEPPLGPQNVPDAVPHWEPRSLNGNPPFYEVFGKRYYVLSSSAGYLERGVASWYGPGFHAERTSSGERYDMYGMTAAHKTLPLPAYVRVTNLQNARSIVVRVNDRGPFVGNRIIDLSYTAAAKLDMLHDGTAMVEVRDIDPAQMTSPTPPPAARLSNPSLFVQAGAFADPANAQRLADTLRSAGYGPVLVRGGKGGGERLYRVRIGPVQGVSDFDRIAAALERSGINDAHLATD